MQDDLLLYLDDALADYGFGADHPFNDQRFYRFKQACQQRGLVSRARLRDAVSAPERALNWFHHPDYVELVKRKSATGSGYLDYGDTPAFPGVYEATATVVGCGLDALATIMAGQARRAFIPIAGLHHARRDSAAGFCVFNDCGVMIEALRRDYGVKRVAYIDIDAHHGDGVFYGFEADPNVIFVDIHQDGRTLYPGTGAAHETGRGPARGTKLNLPLPPQADDARFFEAWERAESFLLQHGCEFVILQCGVDSLQGDPLTSLCYSERAHGHAAARLREFADVSCEGRLIATGGGGYNLDNIERGWCAVAENLL